MFVSILSLCLCCSIHASVLLPANTWLANNQDDRPVPYTFTYIPPPWLEGILNPQPSLTPFQQNYVDTIEFPYNLLVPPYEATLTYPLSSPQPATHNQRILAELTLSAPSKATWPSDTSSFYTVMLIDVSIRNNQSVIQWAVTNIKGNDITGGDEIMEYVTPVAWRNCYNNLTNHGESCTGEGIIYDKDYVHRNVLYVFKQANGKVEVEDGERNSGCQMNLQSTISNTGTWSYDNVISFMTKYSLELHAATWFATPFSPMVGSVLCQYHACLGNLFSAFLAPTVFPTTIISLPGVTDLDKCGPQKFYDSTGTHPLSLDNGQRDPLDWSQLYCANCTAMILQGTRAGPGFTGIKIKK